MKYYAYLKTFFVFLILFAFLRIGTAFAVNTEVSEALKRSFLSDFGYQWVEASEEVQEKYVRTFNRRQKEIKAKKKREERERDTQRRLKVREIKLKQRKHELYIQQVKREEILQQKQKEQERKQARRRMLKEMHKLESMQ